MKNSICAAFILSFLFFGCKFDANAGQAGSDLNPAENSKTVADGNATPSQADTSAASTVIQKMGKANGFDNWSKVTELQFTFNVDRASNPHFERTWIWKPKTNQVTAITENDSISYNRNKLDSISDITNANFINDKFWLLAPLNLVWDEDNLTAVHKTEAEAPISKEPLQKLSVTYGDQGGYTPGDAYDLYFDDDYKVKEWVFRKTNQAEPSMTTTWEDYSEKGGLQFAKTHKNEDASFKLYFTDVVVLTE